MADEEQIPLQRRLGLRFLQFLIVVVALLLARNCILIITDSSDPELNVQQQYYEKGFEAGKLRGINGQTRGQPRFPNQLLERKYRDGYRDGWDETRQKENFEQ